MEGQDNREQAQKLIEKLREIPVLHETDARNCPILYLQNCLYLIETGSIGDEVSSRAARIGR